MMSASTQVEDRSGNHQSRLPRAAKSTAAGPKHAVAARPAPSSSSSTTTRRKRTTDQAFSTDQDFKNDDNHRILRPRNSNISAAAVSKALTATQPNASAEGHERGRIPLSVINSAGAPWKELKSKIPVFSSTNVISKLRKPSGDTTVQKTEIKPAPEATPTPSRSPSPTPTERSSSPTPIITPPETPTPQQTAFPASIFDAVLFADGEHLPIGQYLSSPFKDFDDLARWDMESLPSIPSPPTSPVNDRFNGGNTTTTTSGRLSPPPFSTPIDDDVLLETDKDFPYPFLHRNSKVVHENMGVKKKTLTRTKSSRNLHAAEDAEPFFPTPFELRPSGLPGLPDPLPLRKLSPFTTAPSPFLSSVHADPTTFAKSTTPASSPKRNTRTWRDKAGVIHLGADDIDITFSFPKDISHFDFWDCNDDAILPCPVDLCILAKDSFPWTGKPFAIPELTLFDIRVEDVPGPARMVSFNAVDQFSTHYSSARATEAPPSTTDTDIDIEDDDDLIFDPFSDLEPAPKSKKKSAKSQKGNKDNNRKKDHSLVIHPDKLTVEQDWRKAYVYPPAHRAAVAAADEAKRDSSLGRNFRRVFRRVNASTNPDVLGGGLGGVRYEHRGWTRTVWVPVPARLFAKRETRVLRIHARVWVNGDEERAVRLDDRDSHAYNRNRAPARTGPFDALFGRPTPDDDDDDEDNARRRETDASPLLAETLFSVSHLRSHRELDMWL